jgi:GNAT superfamily N-acetyltransferase
MEWTIVPATADRWRDVELLFGKNGACGGCWCMWWRFTRADFEKNKGAANRKALKKLIASGAVPGILAYSGDQPIGWCAIAPREAYPVLERSRTLKRVDERAVWSVTCFFVTRRFRRRGVSVALLRAAVEHALAHGGRVIEGYPVAARGGRMPDAFAWTGLHSCFVAAGFSEVLRRSPSRPIMRYIADQPTGDRVLRHRPSR